MSCWVKQSTTVLSDCKADLLQKAVASLGYTLDSKIKKVGNTYGNSNCDAGFKKGSEVLPLGISYAKNGEKTKATLVGDYYRTGINEKEFVNQISVAYSKCRIQQVCDENGYAIDVNTVNEKGEAVIEAWQYAQS